MINMIDTHMIHYSLLFIFIIWFVSFMGYYVVCI